jgi:hypothetical protein
VFGLERNGEVRRDREKRARLVDEIEGMRGEKETRSARSEVL